MRLSNLRRADGGSIFVMNSVTLRRIEQVIVAGMVLGTIGMFQPWVLELYHYGFLLLGLSTLAFIVISHVPQVES
jgi:hypothetical protein